MEQVGDVEALGTYYMLICMCSVAWIKDILRHFVQSYRRTTKKQGYICRTPKYGHIPHTFLHRVLLTPLICSLPSMTFSAASTVILDILSICSAYLTSKIGFEKMVQQIFSTVKHDVYMYITVIDGLYYICIRMRQCNCE